MKIQTVLIIPDSFKGSLTAVEAASLIADELKRINSQFQLIRIPMADGGEGSLDTILGCIPGERHTITVCSPDGRSIQASYGIIDNAHEKTAIIEMAQASGLTKQIGLHPLTATTYGVGQLIRDALDQGIRHFEICVGGSATTDGGCGMAAALGVQFLDREGRSFVPAGGSLQDIQKIDLQNRDPRIAESEFIVMSDVNNPLTGPNGAAYVYGPQKGADPQQQKILDEGLDHLASLLIQAGMPDLRTMPGAGAAGGLGGGCAAFLNAEIRSGIDELLKITNFYQYVSTADLIVTGEGRLDSQSLEGKVLTGILKGNNGKPVCSICGSCALSQEQLQRHRVHAYPLTAYAATEECIRNPAAYIPLAVQDMIREMTE